MNNTFPLDSSHSQFTSKYISPVLVAFYNFFIFFSQLLCDLFFLPCGPEYSTTFSVEFCFLNDWQTRVHFMIFLHISTCLGIFPVLIFIQWDQFVFNILIKHVFTKNVDLYVKLEYLNIIVIILELNILYYTFSCYRLFRLF